MAKNKNKNVQNIKGNNIPEKVNDITKEVEKGTTPDVNINNENEGVTNKNQEIKALDNKDNIDVNTDDKEVIKVLDDNNKPISEDIEKENVKNLGIKNKQNKLETRNRKLYKAINGEYYEEISEDMGMWSRTGEVFRLIDLD